MTEKPKQPSEWKQRRTIGFTSPFNLRTCQQRLQRKLLGERRVWKSSLILSKVNEEAHEVHITRGLAIIDGRLDMLTEKSTLVSLTAHINWPLLLGIFTVVEVIFSPLLALLLGYIYSNSLGRESVNIYALGGSAFAGGIFLAFMLSMVFLSLLNRWGRRSGSETLRMIESALIDQITDVPDLSALEMDGQIIFKQFERESPKESDELARLHEIDAKQQHKN
jgi:hypothetical protein